MCVRLRGNNCTPSSGGNNNKKEERKKRFIFIFRAKIKGDCKNSLFIVLLGNSFEEIIWDSQKVRKEGRIESLLM